MKHQILDLVATGATQDWSYTGPSAWESCLRGSGDATYIVDNVINHVCQLVVQQGSVPQYGFVSSIRLHYRAQYTATLLGPNVIEPSLIHNGNTITGALWSPSNHNWTDVYYDKFWAYDPMTPTRFVAADLADLTLSFRIGFSPADGDMRISEAWLDVEFCDAVEYYDSTTMATTPDAVPGYLAWNTAGAQAQAFILGGLYFEDISPVDYRTYWRDLALYQYPTATEVTMDVRLIDAGVTPASVCVARLAQVDDGSRSVWLTVVQSGGAWYLGLVSGSVNVDDITAYITTSLLTAAEIADMNYIALQIDRNEDPGSPGQVVVEFNHAVRLIADYRDFAATTTQQIGFGTGDATHVSMADASVFLNFFAWRHYQVAGPRFVGWEQDCGGTNAVVPNSTDYAICKIQPAPGPYLGMQVGQSNYCCELVVQDPAELCSVYQIHKLPGTAQLWDVHTEYRMTAPGVGAVMLIQRLSDFQYWDELNTVWSVPEVTIPAMPFFATRCALTFAAEFDIGALLTDTVIIKIRAAGAVAGSVVVYKVRLIEA